MPKIRLPRLGLKLLCIILFIGSYSSAQQVTGKKEIVTSSNDIDVKKIGAEEKNADIEALESKKKKVENEKSFKQSHNLPVPSNARGKTFVVKKADSRAPQTNNAPGDRPDPAPSLNFRAIVDNNTSIPPDCAGSVGEDFVMTALNTEIKFQTRKGDSVLQLSLDGFFEPITGETDVFDPKVIYDRFERRWVITACAHGGFSKV
ncbi:MAG: hypothetical protein ACXVB0_17845 [Mucilaginibacter sp.]